MIRLAWGLPVEHERRNRIRIAVYAYAYEFLGVSIVTDAEFDTLARSIRPEMETGHEVLDRFFQTQFDPDTGQWVHHHPELDRVANLCRKHYLQRMGGTAAAGAQLDTSGLGEGNGGRIRVSPPPAAPRGVMHPPDRSGDRDRPGHPRISITPPMR